MKVAAKSADIFITKIVLVTQPPLSQNPRALHCSQQRKWDVVHIKQSLQQRCLLILEPERFGYWTVNEGTETSQVSLKMSICVPKMNERVSN